MKAQRTIWSDGQCVFVVRKGHTTNEKISDCKALVQTYTFSLDQWKLANSGRKITLKEFFAADRACCLDCPFSGNMGEGGCYAHKFMQYSGFLALLRSIKAEDLTDLTSAKYVEILKMSEKTYIRFGTYGEPSLLPFDLVSDMCAIARNWTGYTHQHKAEFAQPFSAYFMASTHSELAETWRSFAVINSGENVGAITCPASKEAGYKSNCARCGLCSGTAGKGSKSVQIINHA